MSIEDKLRAIEEIWADLTSTPDNIPSSSWHIATEAVVSLNRLVSSKLSH